MQSVEAPTMGEALARVTCSALAPTFSLAPAHGEGEGRAHDKVKVYGQDFVAASLLTEPLEPTTGDATLSRRSKTGEGFPNN